MNTKMDAFQALLEEMRPALFTDKSKLSADKVTQIGT